MSEKIIAEKTNYHEREDAELNCLEANGEDKKIEVIANKPSKTQVLTDDRVPAMKSSIRVRIKQYKHKNVINVGRGKSKCRCHYSSDQVSHSVTPTQLR